MTSGNLLGGPPPTYLPDDPAAGLDPEEGARTYPASSSPWAALADAAYDRGEVLASYAYARTGYHRGLDALRRNGWKGHGPVPWSHVPNRGFLRSLAALATASERFDDAAEAQRCREFLRESSPEAYAELVDEQ